MKGKEKKTSLIMKGREGPASQMQPLLPLLVLLHEKSSYYNKSYTKSKENQWLDDALEPLFPKCQLAWIERAHRGIMQLVIHASCMPLLFHLSQKESTKAN